MKIGLHDSEQEYLKRKTFPNYALMKISAYHKSLGDKVEWWIPLDSYDRVYSSKIFDFTPENPYLPPDTIKGGTGYDIHSALPDEIEKMYPDYSIYPECDYAIGYITRGCPNHCRWCIVPEKEGGIKPYRTWKELVRPDSNKLVLMDNNILACEYGINQLESMIGSGYKIDLNQGMDARLVTDKIAEILARLKWIKYIRFSCDTKGQIKAVENAVKLLGKHGVKPYKVFIYLLVTSDIDNAVQRVECLKKFKGITIYAQAERNERLGIIPNKPQLEFAQRYIYSGKYRKENWHEYCEKKKQYGGRKMNKEELSKIYDCPNCNTNYEIDYDGKYKFCPECGQAIDWSEEQNDGDEVKLVKHRTYESPCEQIKWERDTAIKQLESYGVKFCENAEVRKAVHGREIVEVNYVCFCCGFKVCDRYDYCPNCGAKMY